MSKLNTKQRIIVVSLFSGIDLFMLGLIKKNTGLIPGYACEWNFSACLIHRANYLHPDGTPVMEPFIPISREEYDTLRENKDTIDTVGIIDGQYYRTKWIQEVNGRDIRRAIEGRYGKDVILLVAGGPPCQLLTSLSARGRKGMAEDKSGEKNSRHLIFEYLRILKELSEGEGNGNVVGLMEEVPELREKQFEVIYDEFVKTAKTLPYHFAEQLMCSTHYGGNQSRWRYVMQFVHKSYDTLPVFPEPDTINVKRVKDFLDIDRFLSGHFIDGWKTKHHFMCTVTKGSPKEFAKAGKKRPPTWDELFLCFDVKTGEYIVPAGITATQLRQAIANAVCVSLANALAKTIIEKVLRLRHIGDGYFIPIDIPADESDTSSNIGPDAPTPIDGDAGARSMSLVTDSIEGSITNDTPIHSDGEPTASIAEEPVHSEIVIKPEISADAFDPTNPVIIPTNVESEKTILAISKSKAVPVPVPAKYYESGFELWRGKSKLNGADIVAVLTIKSQNTKTGDMCQLWILTADRSPLEAVQTATDDAICGSCKLRHSQDGACNVYVGQEPLTVWKAWRNGAYPKLPMKYYGQLAGLSIRFGAYGDPAAIPIDILIELKRYAKNYTGYTHQWRDDTFGELKSLCMASVDNPEEYRVATEKGWRTYRVKTAADPLLPGEGLCPHITSGVQCKACQLCTGNTHKGRNIAIPVHGVRKSKFKAVSGKLSPADAKAASAEDKGMDEIAQSQEVHKPQIISSSDLVKMQFESLPLTAEWKELLGEPSVNFHLVLHGIAGQGKSTFGLQLAKYLSQTFGNTLYIAAEEGFERTLKDKVLNLHAESDTLHVANFRNYEDIMRIIQPGCYKFIFIDSLDRMKINAQKLNLIRHRYKDAALITISQATKAGQMRGSYELAHDSDIVIEVVDGVAVTTKNRFKEKGMRFDAFQYMKPSESKYEFLDKPPHFSKLRSSEPLSIQDQIVALNDRLSKAVADEDYVLAARLRDQIREIEKLHP